jgi:hypothetical protein
MSLLAGCWPTIDRLDLPAGDSRATALVTAPDTRHTGQRRQGDSPSADCGRPACHTCSDGMESSVGCTALHAAPYCPALVDTGYGGSRGLDQPDHAADHAPGRRRAAAIMAEPLIRCRSRTGHIACSDQNRARLTAP